MATRLYLGVVAGPTSPAFTTGWEVTASAVRRVLDNATFADSVAESLAVATALNSPASAVDVLIAQYTSAPLDVNQTITGTIKGQIRALESNAAADLRAQIVVWTMKTDGTVRGTNLGFDTAALSSEFGTAAANRKFPRGGATTLTSVAALATDRLVIEVGYRKHENATNSRTGTLNPMGNFTGTDLPEDETDTSAVKVPWFEFSQALTFAVTEERVSQDAMEALVLPDNGAIRVSQDAMEALVLPDNGAIRVSQDAIEVLRRTGPDPSPQIIICG